MEPGVAEIMFPLGIAGIGFMLGGFMAPPVLKNKCILKRNNQKIVLSLIVYAAVLVKFDIFNSNYVQL